MGGGCRVRRPVYGESRREVAAKLADLMAKTAVGVPLAVDAWTVERYGAHRLEHVVGPRLKPATVSSYRATLRLHIVPTLGRVRLRTLTPSQVRELLSAKRASGLGDRSVQIIHGTLRTMLGEGMREELVGRNVASLVRGPVIRRDEVKPWSPEEASVFLAATSSHRLYALFAVGVALGLRKGELLALRWEDVDLENGLFTCAATCSGFRGVWCSDRRSRPGLGERSRFQRRR
jgi:integrase